MNASDIPNIFYSVLENDADELRSKLYNKLDVNTIDSHEQTCLHLSAYLGNVDIADILIKYGAQVNSRDRNGSTPLLKACASNMPKIVKLLMSNGADINSKDNKWQRAIHICASRNSIECLRIILPFVTSINIADCEGRTALHHAVIGGGIDIIKILLENGASVSVCDKDNMRPIHWAAARGDVEILNLLVECGANINVRNKEDYIPLHVASSMGCIDTVVKLIEMYSDLDSVTLQGNNVIHLACGNNHTNVVEELIKALNSPHLFIEHLKVNSDKEISTEIKDSHMILLKERLECILNVGNYQGLTPLHILAQMDNTEHCIDTLLTYGASPNLLSEDGKTPLHFATAKNQLNQSKLLINAAADVNIQDEQGNTPLHVGCKYGYDNLVQVLLDHKADPFIAGEDGMLPIQVAISNGHHGCLNKLLDHVFRRTHINNLDNDNLGRNVVHHAVIGGSLKCLEKVIRLGGDIQHEDNSKQTPLHLAVKLDNFLMTRILTKLKAIIEVEDEYSCTPLHYAAMYNKDGNIIKLLIENGADILSKINVQDNIRIIEANAGDICGIENKLVYPAHFAAVYGNSVGLSILLDAMPKDIRLDCIYGFVESNPFDGTHRGDIISIVNLASYHDQFDVLSFLVKTYSKNVVLTQDRNGRTPLHLAAYQDHATVVKFLLACGSKPTAVDNDYLWNPLHYAASQGSIDVVSEIIQSVKGVDKLALVDSVDEHKRSPLMVAIQNGHVDTAEKLIKNDALIDREDTYGRTSLHRACSNGHIDCVELLLQNDVKVELFDFRGRSAIHMAATGGHVDIIIRLIEYMRLKYKQRDDDVKDSELFIDELKELWFDRNYFTPLHFAAARGHKNCFEFLFKISEGFSPNQQSILTPLHCAVESKCEDILDTALQLSCVDLIDVPDRYSWTPIFYGVKDDNAKAVKMLIDHNANINYQDRNGCSPLMIAAKEGSLSCLHILLDNDNLQWALIDKIGQSVLHHAAQCNDDSIGILILERLPKISCLINVQDHKLQTPSHLAASHGLPVFLNALISRNADLFLLNNSNQLPIVSCGYNEKVSECISICITAMFPNEFLNGLLSVSNQTNVIKKTSAIKDMEMEGSIQSSENEYF